MFDSGARIKVFLSSVKGGKVGPRTGSVGYAIDNGIKSPESMPYYKTEIEAVLSLKRIIFTRFGNENKKRCEHKKVICVIPVPLFDHYAVDKTYFSKSVSHFMEKPLNKRFVDQARKNFNRKNTPVVFALPHPAGSEHVFEKNEFDAWVTAVCRSEIARAMVDDFVRNIKIASVKSNVDTYRISMFQELMTRDKKFVSELIDKTPYLIRKKYVENFSRLMAVSNQKVASNLPHQFMELFAERAGLTLGGNFNYISAYSLMASIIFKGAFLTIHKSLANSNIKNLKALSFNFLKLKSEILTNKLIMEK